MQNHANHARNMPIKSQDNSQYTQKHSKQKSSKEHLKYKKTCTPCLNTTLNMPCATIAENLHPRVAKNSLQKVVVTAIYTIAGETEVFTWLTASLMAE